MSEDRKTIEERGDGRAVQLKNVRMAFTGSLYEKKPTVKDGVPKHSFNVINVADRAEYEANKAKIIAGLEAASEKTWKDKNRWKRIMENDPKRVCYREGKRFANSETGITYAGFEGNYGISVGCPAKGQKRPKKLIDRYKRPVEEKDILDVFYSGTFADVVLEFYGTNEGGPGIFCTCNAVRSRQEGDNLGGGGVPVEDEDFDDLEDDDDSFSSPSAGETNSSSDDLFI
jgi:hypothetical protein